MKKLKFGLEERTIDVLFCRKANQIWKEERSHFGPSLAALFKRSVYKLCARSQVILGDLGTTFSLLPQLLVSYIKWDWISLSALVLDLIAQLCLIAVVVLCYLTPRRHRLHYRPDVVSLAVLRLVSPQRPPSRPHHRYHRRYNRTSRGERKRLCTIFEILYIFFRYSVMMSPYPTVNLSAMKRSPKVRYLLVPYGRSSWTETCTKMAKASIPIMFLIRWPS